MDTSRELSSTTNASVCPAPGLRLRVLWIDDDESVMESCRSRLHSQGIQIDAATDGESGLASTRARATDLIILDENLPGISGLDVLDALRRDGNRVPVILLTAYGSIDSAFRAAQLGAVQYCEKPLVGDDLLRTIWRASGIHACADVADSGRAACWMRELEASWRTAPPQRTLTRLLCVLAYEPLPIPVLVAGADLFRRILVSTDEKVEHVAASLDHVKELVRRNLAMGPGTRSLTARLQAALAVNPLLRIEEFAAIVRQHRSVISRLLIDDTGAGFREWKWGQLMRPALRELADGDEHVAQIAFRSGYEHSHQFHRDFIRLFGLRPLDFRRLARQRAREV
jgi:CheY-like chemotaxis protein